MLEILILQGIGHLLTGQPFGPVVEVSRDRVDLAAVVSLLRSSSSNLFRMRWHFINVQGLKDLRHSPGCRSRSWLRSGRLSQVSIDLDSSLIRPKQLAKTSGETVGQVPMRRISPSHFDLLNLRHILGLGDNEPVGLIVFLILVQDVLEVSGQMVVVHVAYFNDRFTHSLTDWNVRAHLPKARPPG